ncbi:MAG: VWA domain-containing protein, partial [Myxococcales bacterium]|nr:VWA domain-containing protein [Myxococcales bacterium]
HWLYGREPGEGGGAAQGPRQAGDGPSQLTVPDWINEVHTLFPKETIERLEKDAVETYGIAEVVTDPAVLERAEPNPALLRAVLQTKHLMDERLLAAARTLVKKVVQQLVDELAEEVRTPLHGLVARDRSSRFARGPLDLRRTLRGNLKNVDRQSGQLVVDRTWFFERRTRRLDTWQILVVVDQSGSMLDSTIHAAVTASILAGLPGIRSHLIAFDTEVVDLSSDVRDPVQTLMSVQLGGGTYIAKAVEYAAGLVQAPSRAILVLITDFFEGDTPGRLERIVGDLVAQGTLVLGLAALDRECVPAYDRELAGRLVKRGAHVGAMTPGQLATWIAERIRR